MTPELASFLTMAFTNPQAFAERMGRTGVRPGELAGMLGGGGGGVGDAFTPAAETGAGAFARPDLRLPDQTPPSDTMLSTGNPLGVNLNTSTFGADVPDSEPPPVQPGNPAGLDFSGSTGGLDIIGPILGMMGGGGTPPPGPGGPGGLNMTGTGGAGNRWPQVRMPDATKPEFRGGIAGAQKAPDQQIKPGPSPAQFLMMLMQQAGQGKGATGTRVPSLGEMFMR